MALSFSEITQFLGHVWWPFMRFTGFFMVAPIFSDKAIPMQFKVMLAFILGLICSSLSGHVPAFNPFSFTTILLSGYQILFGWVLGYCVTIFMAIFTMAGQALSMQMGLGMAIMNDPSNGVNEAIVAKIFSITSIFLFLSFDAHLVVITVMADSFTFWPLSSPIPVSGLEHVLKMITWLFSSSLIISIPAMVVMLISNTVFGFMTKAAPQLNIFALGFPLTMLLGLIALSISIKGVGETYFDLTMQLKNHLYYIMGLKV
ncbi:MULTISPECIES: flagellar biosynthetic protein FliR [Vibrio]|uniref:flagellar biosynthetic protein FliR n=1 Tax=Vibrio TaxID=662 RepID=UPI000B5C4077|nr:MULTISPECIES: flagellar biosynthetic protein FliR [Vibrio]HBV77559.1 flagellar biosynthetic protein FliR [Vibrio sp.]